MAEALRIRADRVAGLLLVTLALASPALAEVVRIEVTRRNDFGSYERVIGRVYFTIDPMNAANRGIADVDRAPKNGRGQVEFSSELLMFIPTNAATARGTALLEVVNRGRDQILAVMSGAAQSDLRPESWVLGDRFLLEQGFTVAFLGWQFDVMPSQGLTFNAPIADVEGLVRESHVQRARSAMPVTFALAYCASGDGRGQPTVTFRTRIDAAPARLAAERWAMAADGCSVTLTGGADEGLYEAMYLAHGSPVAGLGLAAIRDFASHLKYGATSESFGMDRRLAQRVIGYGYSQSARFLREFVRDGFNADERARAVFDGLMIASPGAGAGSFNHRFATPSEAGNSVLSILRTVDVPPFTDDGLLARARTQGAVPKIMYTATSTEYWARAVSLTYTDIEATADVPFADTSRMYFVTGTPHSSGVFPPAMLARGQTFQYFTNFAQQRWVDRALLMALDVWVTDGTAPPSSRYPRVSRGELVTLDRLTFPTVPSFPRPGHMPKVWQLDFGDRFAETKVITNEPPRLGRQLRVLVPQVNTDGNDVGGIPLPEVQVPLGTFTGWNVSLPQAASLDYLAGLFGSFHPFARTREEREAARDSRLSIAERYSSRDDYLETVRRAAEALVSERLMLRSDVPSVVERARVIWDAVAAPAGASN